MFSQKKPYSAVTVAVERLTSETYDEDDMSGIPELVDAIKLQATGPTEAARAIRKKLKYGNVHRQLRALAILDGLIQNAGPQFQRAFADEPLLERLRFCATSDLSDPDVKKKCSVLFRSWAADFSNTRGLEGIAKLHKQLPRRKQAVTQDRSRAVRETDNPFGEDEEESKPSPQQQQPHHQHSSSSSSSAWPSAFSSGSGIETQPTGRVSSFSYMGSSKDKKKKDKSSSSKNKGGSSSSSRQPFNLAAEQDAMKTTIAESTIAATKLTNTLQTINRERERISENQQAVMHFETCKHLRRKILRYIHHVESEEWLGSLLNANDQLITALMTFEQLDRSIDADSDSEDDIAEQAHAYRMLSERQQQSPTSPTSTMPNVAGLSISPRRTGGPPPRPSPMSKPQSPVPRGRVDSDEDDDDDDDDGDDVDDDDENDPFADRNAVVTPKVERNPPRW